MSDRVNKVAYYNALPIECIDVIKWFDLPIGNVIKYCWRAGLKKEEGIADIDKEIEDLKKAEYYLKCKINMLEEKKKREKLIRIMDDITAMCNKSQNNE